uniref:Histone H2A n=1 Tax=Sexangularia sp. CB-2014 TaxID=1486929 RepID=A0A6U0JRI5_9EUKA|mmetsp:Transcript_7908/g.25293  ORF Transcript_7908/g.25293 Transcript_7908/m.25293 type:complete len:290 (+) Transcript_7908:60-929(+)
MFLSLITVSSTNPHFSLNFYVDDQWLARLRAPAAADGPDATLPSLSPSTLLWLHSLLHPAWSNHRDIAIQRLRKAEVDEQVGVAESLAESAAVRDAELDAASLLPAVRSVQQTLSSLTTVGSISRQYQEENEKEGWEEEREQAQEQEQGQVDEVEDEVEGASCDDLSESEVSSDAECDELVSELSARVRLALEERERERDECIEDGGGGGGAKDGGAVAQDAIVFLTTVVRYLTREMIETVESVGDGASGVSANDRLTPRHLLRAVQRDPEIQSLLLRPGGTKRRRRNA